MEGKRILEKAACQTVQTQGTGTKKNQTRGRQSDSVLVKSAHISSQGESHRILGQFILQCLHIY